MIELGELAFKNTDFFFNVEELVRSGRPVKQAVAIAYSVKRKSSKKKPKKKK